MLHKFSLGRVFTLLFCSWSFLSKHKWSIHHHPLHSDKIKPILHIQGFLKTREGLSARQTSFHLWLTFICHVSPGRKTLATWEKNTCNLSEITQWFTQIKELPNNPCDWRADLSFNELHAFLFAFLNAPKHYHFITVPIQFGSFYKSQRTYLNPPDSVQDSAQSTAGAQFVYNFKTISLTHVIKNLFIPLIYSR